MPKARKHFELDIWETQRAANLSSTSMGPGWGFGPPLDPAGGPEEGVAHDARVLDPGLRPEELDREGRGVEVLDGDSGAGKGGNYGPSEVNKYPPPQGKVAPKGKWPPFSLTCDLGPL